MTTTTSTDRAVTLADAHSSGMPADDRARFMAAFDAARTAVAQGWDTEERWLRLSASHAPGAPAMMAGYLEGLASLRRPGGGTR